MDDDRAEVVEALRWCCQRLYAPTFSDADANKIAQTCLWVSAATAGERDVMEAMLHRLAECCSELLVSLMWRGVPDAPAVLVGDLQADLDNWRSAMHEAAAQIEGDG
jgi:hypothetical protein